MLSKTPSTLRLNIEVVFVVLCAYLGKAFAHRTHLEWRHGLGGERPVSPCAAIAIATTDRAGTAKFITSTTLPPSLHVLFCSERDANKTSTS